MKRRLVALRTLLVAVFAFAIASLAHAQSSRTWVSTVGDDANPCSRTAPCKTFAMAVAKAASNGEVNALDAGTYGIVNITKSMTINGVGTMTAIGNSAANGVIVTAAATDVIILRNIAINGGDNGINGIKVVGARIVQVDHCWIYGQETHGINVDATDSVSLKVNDTVIENCAGDGIHIRTTAGTAVLSVDNVRIQDCGSDGIQAVDNVVAAIRNSILTQNASTGIQTSGINNQLNLDHVFVSSSNVGLQASAGSTLRVSDSVIAQNATGLSANGGTIDSFQGNSLMGNITNGAFNSTTVKQ
jgi:hypothetical protein